VFARGSEIFLAKNDGTNVEKLIGTSGVPSGVRFSPDGKRIRFDVNATAPNSGSLWEVGSDGSNLRPLLAGWHTTPVECCGRWTPGTMFSLREQTSGRCEKAQASCVREIRFPRDLQPGRRPIRIQLPVRMEKESL